MTEKLHRSHNLEKTRGADGVTTSGSFSFWENSPVSPLNIGDAFQPVPGGPLLKVSRVSVSDSVVGERLGRLYRQWKITVEGDGSVSASGEAVRYTFSVERQDSGLILKSGTMEVTNDGVEPVFHVEVGASFTVPGVGTVVCTKIGGADASRPDGSGRWTTTYDGRSVEAPSGAGKPEDTTSSSYELNGVTVRSVSGELIALRRSLSSVHKKSLTVYNDTGSPLTVPGGSYSGGIVVSERVARESLTVDGVKIGGFYRHDIEVES